MSTIGIASSPQDDANPFLTASGRLFYDSTRDGAKSEILVTSRASNGSFALPALLTNADQSTVLFGQGPVVDAAEKYICIIHAALAPASSCSWPS